MRDELCAKDRRLLKLVTCREDHSRRPLATVRHVLQLPTTTYNYPPLVVPLKADDRRWQS